MNILKVVLPVCLGLILCLPAPAQSRPNSPKRTSSGLSVAGQVSTLVIGSAAQAAWETTKFGGRHLAKPAAKTLLVKGGSKAAIFVLKSSGLGAKYLLPFAVKLSLL